MSRNDRNAFHCPLCCAKLKREHLQQSASKIKGYAENNRVYVYICPGMSARSPHNAVVLEFIRLRLPTGEMIKMRIIDVKTESRIYDFQEQFEEWAKNRFTPKGDRIADSFK